MVVLKHNPLVEFPIGRTVLELQFHNPDISPYDFHIFDLLKKMLKFCRFHFYIQVVNNVRNWFDSQSKDFHEQFGKTVGLVLVLCSA